MEKFIIDLLAGLTPPTLLGVLIFSIINVLIPKKIIKKINIAGLEEKSEHRTWLLMACSFSLLLGLLLVNLFKPSMSDYIYRHKIETRLERLTSEEKTTLRIFIDKKTQQICDYDWATPGLLSLKKDEIVFIGSERHKQSNFLCYILESWAYIYLTKHQELLDQ